MRIREDGKHEHRSDTIEQAAEFWNCNKTTALVRSAEFAWRMDERVRTMLSRNELPTPQKREIVETLGIAGAYELDSEETVKVER